MGWIRGQVETKVKDVLENNLGVDPEDIRDNSSLADDMGADSLDSVEIAMELEAEFGIEIPDEKAVQIKTFKDAVDTVCELLGI